MFLLCMCGVLQYILDQNTAIAIEQMPQPLLEMSLKHVNTLLTDIGDKIIYERELLSQLEPDKESKTAIPLQKEGTRQNRVNTARSDKEAARQLIQLWKLSRAGNIVPELENEPIEDSEFTTPTATTKEESFFDKTVSKQSMLLFMEKQNVSYCLASVRRGLEALYNKSNDDVEVFFDALTTALWRLADNGKLDCLGPLLRNRILRLSIWAKVTAPLYIKRFMRKVVIALDDRYFIDKDAEKVILTYDSLYTDEEGDKLLDSVVIIEAYNIKARGKEATSQMCENFINKFIAPVNRLCETFFLKTLINDINIVYALQYPLSSRSARKSIMDSLIESKTMTATIRNGSICKQYKGIKCDYKKRIQQLFVKFPIIFEKFADHYRRSEERIDEGRKQCTSYRSTNQTTLQKRISGRIFKKLMKQNSEEMTSESFQFTFSWKNMSSNIESTSQFFFPIIHVRNDSLDILKSSFTDNSVRFEKSNTSKLYNKLTQQPSSSNKRRKKTSLDKIIGESSYSDQEMYLQVMLKDALFHPNNRSSG